MAAFPYPKIIGQPVPTPRPDMQVELESKSSSSGHGLQALEPQFHLGHGMHGCTSDFFKVSICFSMHRPRPPAQPKIFFDFPMQPSTQERLGHPTPSTPFLKTAILFRSNCAFFLYVCKSLPSQIQQFLCVCLLTTVFMKLFCQVSSCQRSR